MSSNQSNISIPRSPCRHCGATLQTKFVDLGFAPPSNAYLGEAALRQAEMTFPLRVHVCASCWLVQTEDYTTADQVFSSDYAYFSSTSKSWLQHAEAYTDSITKRLGLNEASFVIEVASNDGYLLKNFVAASIPCLGIEPTDSTANAAEKLGISVLREFFGASLAKRLVEQNKVADLICGNNVFAHVPDINDFTQGLKIALKPRGTITLEFPHLKRLIELCQFDTIYHEHFSYLSLHATCRIFESAGLRVFDVEELSTHGGSLRVYGCHADDDRTSTANVALLLKTEIESGLLDIGLYRDFQRRAESIKNNLLSFLIDQRRRGALVAGYGAAAKGNTLLNFAGVRPDLISFISDGALAKQNRFMPGSHIPILPPSAIDEHRPDFVLILPWNISDEIQSQLSQISRWGGKFVVAVPDLRIL